MKKALNIIILLVVCVATLKACEYSLAKMEHYEQTNNCRYDYNGLCYTENERPWLFGKGCTSDWDCEHYGTLANE